MTRRNARSAALLVAASLLVAAPLAAASDHDDDDFDAKERKVLTQVDAQKALFKLEREDAAGEDELKFEFDTEDATAKVSYEKENASTEREITLKVRFLELVEFRDADGDGAYDAGEERVQAVRLEGASWRDLGVRDLAEGNDGKALSARADLPGGGVFGLEFYVYGDFAKVGTVEVEPSEVKFDILIEGFPFDAEDTLLALMVETKHEAEFEGRSGAEADRDPEVAGDEDGIVVLAGDVKALFTWKDKAEVDGVEKPVRSTVLRSETETESEPGETEVETKELVALAYARGDSIVHDPILGVASAGQGLNVPAAPVAVALLAVGAAALALARRR